MISIGMMLSASCQQDKWELQLVAKIERSAFSEDVREWLPNEGCWLALSDFWMTELAKQNPMLRSDDEWALVMTNGYAVDLRRSNTAAFYREVGGKEDPAHCYVYRYPRRFYPRMGPGTQLDLE